MSVVPVLRRRISSVESSDSQSSLEAVYDRESRSRWTPVRGRADIRKKEDVQNRIFNINASRCVLGNDSVQPAECTISASTCDLCVRFISAFLSAENLPVSRDRIRSHRKQSDSIIDQDLVLSWALRPVKTTRESKAPDEYPFPVYAHYSTVRKLQKSANHGCSLCELILQSPTPAPTRPRVLAEAINAYSPMLWVQPLNGFGLHTQDDTGLDHNEIHLYEFVIAEDKAECLDLQTNYGNALNHQIFPSFQSGSDRRFDQIRSWTTACASHTSCKRQVHPLPQRLLAVTGSAADSIVLYDTAQFDGVIDRRYIALSYRWGSMSALRTLSDNIDDHKGGIKLSECPAVIQDAVTVARECSIPYLWVDALCICQNDQEEWLRESATMADVYGGSIFTISALSSIGLHHGFLVDRGFQVIRMGTVYMPYESWSESISLLFGRRLGD